MSAPLTATQRKVLARMHNTGIELVYESGVGYLGYRRISWRTVMALVRKMALHASQDSKVGEVERYTISATGRALLAAMENK